MQIILLERVEKLGSIGSVVEVKRGFALNFLIPQGKAMRTTPANIAYYEKMKAELEAENLKKRGTAEEKAQSLNNVSILLVRQASDSGHLYGSVNARDVAAVLSSEYFPVDRSQIVINVPIKTVGVHGVEVRLHPEVLSTVHVCVAQTQEEAEKVRDSFFHKAEPQEAKEKPAPKEKAKGKAKAEAAEEVVAAEE